MHLHGHNMYILHEGEGFYDGQSFINPENPQRRDTQMLRPNGHIVVQYDADNPGVWPFHCHIAWHLSLVGEPVDIFRFRAREAMEAKANLAEGSVHEHSRTTGRHYFDEYTRRCRTDL